MLQPAVHLLDFFESFTRSGGLEPVFSTAIAQRMSETMKNLEPLDEAYVESWLRYWRSSGFL